MGPYYLFFMPFSRTKGSVPEEHFATARRMLLLEMTENTEEEEEEEEQTRDKDSGSHPFPAESFADEDPSQTAAATSETKYEH